MQKYTKNPLDNLRKSWKIHPKSVKIDQNGAKRAQNTSKIHQQSILGSFWAVFGAKSRPGRLQAAHPGWQCDQKSTFWPKIAPQGLILEAILDPFSIKNASKNRS